MYPVSNKVSDAISGAAQWAYKTYYFSRVGEVGSRG